MGGCNGLKRVVLNGKRSGGVSIFNEHLYDLWSDESELFIFYSFHDAKFSCETISERRVEVRLSIRDSYATSFSKIRDAVGSMENRVFIVHDYEDVALISSCEITCAICFIVHGNNDHYYNALEKYKANIDSVISINPAVSKEVLLRFKELDSRYIRQLFPYLPEAWHKPQTKTPSPKRMIFVGRPTTDKGWGRFVRLSESLDSSDWEFVAVLGCNDFQEIHEHIQVHLNLPNSQVLKLLSESDVFCLPSRSEASPLSILEALSKGLICLSSDLPGFDEMYNGFPVILLKDWTVENVKKSLASADLSDQGRRHRVEHFNSHYPTRESQKQDWLDATQIVSSQKKVLLRRKVFFFPQWLLTLAGFRWER